MEKASLRGHRQGLGALLAEFEVLELSFFDPQRVGARQYLCHDKNPSEQLRLSATTWPEATAALFRKRHFTGVESSR